MNFYRITFAEYVSLFTDMDIPKFHFNAEQLSTEITKLLSANYINQVAKDKGFTIRDSGKLDGFMFLDMMVYTHFNHKLLSLNDLSVQLHKRYGIGISKQSIDKRFNSMAVDFFTKVLESVININIESNLEFDFTNYQSVKIKDSTSFQLPENMKDKYPGSGGAASKAAIRIQFEYDLKNKNILDLSIHAFTKQDTTNAKETLKTIKPDELIIRDLGYIIIDVLRQIVALGAYYLNRLPANVVVFEMKQGKLVELDFTKLLKMLRRNGIQRIDKEVYIGRGEKFKTRIIIELIPDKIYKQRLRKANKTAKSKGSMISKKRKTRLALNLFITNTDIPASQVRQLYTLRWQIELMFKIWKSIGEIDKVKKMKIERFEVSLIAKLIWIALNWKIMSHILLSYYRNSDILLSPYKIFKTLKMYTFDFRKAIIAGIQSVVSLINSIAEISPKNHLSEMKNKKLWSYDVIKIFAN